MYLNSRQMWLGPHSLESGTTDLLKTRIEENANVDTPGESSFVDQKIDMKLRSGGPCWIEAERSLITSGQPQDLRRSRKPLLAHPGFAT